MSAELSERPEVMNSEFQVMAKNGLGEMIRALEKVTWATRIERPVIHN